MAVTVAMRTQVSQLYVSLFGRAPDSEGLGFWVAALGGGVTMAQVAESMYNTAPARAYYPAFATNQEIVATFYLNVLGRPADAEGLAFWVKELAAAPSKGAFFTKLLNNVVNYTGTDADGLKSQALFLNKVTVAQYYGENNGSIAESTAALNGVTHEAATVVAAKAIIDGEVGGETYALTSATDKIDISTAIGIDTIRGIVYQPLSSNGESTFTLADEVRGNDKTVLQLLVAEAGDHIDAPYVTVSGVDKLDVIAAQAGSNNAGLHIDASTYGTDISTITVGGKNDFHLEVLNLDVTGQLDIEIAQGSNDVNVDAEGEIDGLNFDIAATNYSSDEVGVDVVVGVAGIDITLGENDILTVTLSNSSSEDGAAVVGDITVGDIQVAVGDDASFGTCSTGLYFYNGADSNVKGAATAGNVTVGDVKLNLGVDSNMYFTITNEATAENGAAKVGNITVGDIEITEAMGASVSFDVGNSADSTKGDATVGDITLGNIMVIAAKSADYAAYLYATNEADATTSGNATAGNLTVGDYTLKGGDEFSWGGGYFSNYANADKGNATVGQTTVGDVSLTIGNNKTGNGYANLYVTANAFVTAVSDGGVGNAKVGDVSVGNINLNAGNNNSLYASVYATAETDKGSATVGNVVIGDVDGVVGQAGRLEFEVDVHASGDTGTIGNITVGAIDMYGEPDAYISVSISADSVGSIGDVTVGNSSMKIDTAQQQDLSGEDDPVVGIGYWIDINAETDVGDVKIGDVSMTLGSQANLEYFTVDVSAATGDVASFTVGDITIDAGILAVDGDNLNTDDSYSDAEYEHWDIYAGNNIGDVKMGDITIDAAKSAEIDDFTVDFLADEGSIGDITIGKQTVVAGVNASAYIDIDFTADDGIGNVTAGDVSVSSSKGGDIWLSNTYAASYDIGNIRYGDVSVAANGAYAYAGFSLGAYANGDTIGAVTVGDVDVTVSGSDSEAYAYIWLNDTDGDQVGDLTVGDVTMTLSNSNTADATTGGGDDYAYASIEFDSNGNVKVGNITVTAGDVTADAIDDNYVSAYFWLNTESSMNIGNITVVGGQMNGNDTLMDNLDVLFNSDIKEVLFAEGSDSGFMELEEEGDGSITIGNIDYRGYEAKALIDVSAFKGAANIYAAQDDTIIVDNKSKNVITLGAGNDDVVLNATNATTDKTLASAIDEIVNFASLKDHLYVESNDTDYDEFDFVSSNAGTYANFLTTAGEAMMNDSTDIYARVLDGSVYVAFDKDNSGTVDYVVKLTGITTLDVTDITIVNNII